MESVDERIKKARANGYANGYNAGMRRASVAPVRLPTYQRRPAPVTWDASPPPGPYADMARSLESMDLFLRGMLAEYPHARGQGRLDKWSAAFMAYVDLVASEDKPAKRANLSLVPRRMGAAP